MSKKNKKSKLRQKLVDKYRLVILNENTLEERLSFKINRLNVYVLSGLFAITVIILTTLLIAFSPLKEYIPGYSSTKLKKTAIKLEEEVSLYKKKLDENEIYIQNIKNILSGNIKTTDLKKDSLKSTISLEDINVQATPEETEFREKIEEKDKYSIFEKATKKTEIVFFAPLKGKVTQNFSPKDKHLAIDIAVPKDTPVKAIADATVVFAGFTADTGYVIILEHKQGYLSVYKHNQNLFKEQGELVKSGEVIATAGNTGHLTSGTHLHFELWSDGYQIDPTKFIEFE